MPVSPLKPIKHAELRGGISSVARDLATDGKDWTGGISFNESCDVHGGCSSCADEPVDKDATSLGDAVTFNPFILYNLQECQGLGRLDGFDQISKDNLRRAENRIIATELHDAACTGNPSLQSSATDITGVGGPAPLCETLIGLVQATCEFGIGEIILHAPLKVMPGMLHHNLVIWNQAANRYEVGHIPISFDCYPNIGPDVTGNIVPADNEAYIYVTGPIEWAKGSVQSAQNFDQHLNEHLAREERLAILRFDPCSVASANALIC